MKSVYLKESYPNSARFLSHKDHLEAMNKAIDSYILDQNILTSNNRGTTISLDMGRDVAEGYFKGGNSKGNTSNVNAVFNQNGELVTL